MYGGAVRMLSRDGEEELVHTAVQNCRQSAGIGDLTLFLGPKDVLKRIAHQRYRQRRTAGVPIVRKP